MQKTFIKITRKSIASVLCLLMVISTVFIGTFTSKATEGNLVSFDTSITSGNTFYYVPTQADESAGYIYKAQVKVLQPNGQNKNTYVELNMTDKTYNGIPIYSLSLNDYTTVTRLTIQTYSGTSWKSQVIVTNSTTASAMNNKMYVKASNSLIDYTVDAETTATTITTDSTFYYVPSQADETASYIYKAQVKVLQVNGQNKNTYVVLTKTDKTYNGTPIYSLSLNDYTTITRLTVQTYSGTSWKSQVIVTNNTTASDMNNKMYVKSTNTLIDYTTDVDTTAPTTETSANTFYYVPKQTDEDAGYIYKAQLKVLQPNGQNMNTYVVMTKTDKTYNGTPIYSLSLEGYTDFTRVTVQTYDDTAWKTQAIIAENTTASALNNKMYVKVSISLIDYTYDSTETTVAPTSTEEVTETPTTTEEPTEAPTTEAPTTVAPTTEEVTETPTTTEEPTTVAPTEAPFEWSKDNWNFCNNTDYFSGSTYADMINSTYSKVLASNLDNYEYEYIFGTDGWLSDTFGGSCYGMSSTELLAKRGYLPFSKYLANATSLFELSAPKDDENISSLITYYQMIQIKDNVQSFYRTTPTYSQKTNIQNICSTLDDNSVCVIGFKQNNWGGHAILGIGYETGSWTYSSKTYNLRIKTCDPNLSIQNYPSLYIYVNTSNYSWTIPAYGSVGSTYGAVFNMICADDTLINEYGYLSSPTSNQTTTSVDYVARLDAPTINENNTITKVAKNDGIYQNKKSSNSDIVADYSYKMNGSSDGTFGYNLFDTNASYKISQDVADKLNLTMEYKDVAMKVSSTNAKSATFDKSGYVEATGESGTYTVKMISDKDYPTKWYALNAKVNDSSNVSLKKVDNGYVLSSDNLQNVTLTANNRTEKVTTTASTTYNSMYIYQSDDTLGVKVDTDNNGTYETVLK